MARALEERLAELTRLRQQPDSPQTAATLKKALANKNSVLVARAARLVGELELAELGEDLAAAFSPFMTNPSRTDKGCMAKTAIAEALYQIASERADIFVAGISWVQKEPVYGGSVDTAAQLRGHCAMGLVQIGYPEVTIRLAHLLADPAPEARLAAARALGYSGHPDGVPLLIHKVLTGDREPQVMGECCAALLALAPRGSLDLVAGLLRDDDPGLAEAAALALGESRLPEAFPILCQAWQEVRFTDTISTILLAIALLRSDESISYLMALLDQERTPVATAAIRALAIYRHDEKVRDQARERLEQRDEPALLRVLSTEFDR